MYSSVTVRALYLFGLVFFLSILSLLSFAQSGSLTGKVTDQKGSPLAGATVKIKETNKATTTNDQGIFTFSAAPSNGVLVISYVGYATLETRFSSGQEVHVSLKEAEG